MLARLELRNFAIMDAIDISFEPGFTVLTGETGAGKSILVDALLLLSGKRADGSLIKEGTNEAFVQATWELPHVTSASRTFTAAGRNTTRVNGAIVTVNDLTQAMAPHLAIFGQHAALQLSEPAYQRTLLDSTLPAEAQQQLAEYRARYHEWQAAQEQLRTITEHARERARHAAALTEQLKFIRQINPVPGEDEELLIEQQRLGQADLLQREVGGAVEQLSFGDENAVAALVQAKASLETAVRSAPELRPFLQELGDILTAAEATANELARWLDDFDADPARLEAVQERLALLERVKRLYGDTLADVLAYQAQAEAELAELSNDDEQVHVLEQQIARLETELRTRQQAITAARTAAGQQLGDAVETLLAPLGFTHAVFSVQLTAAPPTQHGADRVEFLFSANRARTPLPIQQVASGGELSRIMLALNLCTLTGANTMVFDEIDAGIGGATALEVASLLESLGQHHQVLVVSHLAQVAAKADHHYRIEKTETETGSHVRVRRLTLEERLHELARLLSGTVTSNSLAHARELLGERAETDRRVG